MLLFFPFSGDSDSLIGVEDVELLSKLLPNDKCHVLKNENWGHFDFIFNENRGELVYADIVKKLLMLDHGLHPKITPVQNHPNTKLPHPKSTLQNHPCPITPI